MVLTCSHWNFTRCENSRGLTSDVCECLWTWKTWIILNHQQPQKKIARIPTFRFFSKTTQQDILISIHSPILKGMVKDSRSSTITFQLPGWGVTLPTSHDVCFLKRTNVAWANQLDLVLGGIGFYFSQQNYNFWRDKTQCLIRVGTVLRHLKQIFAMSPFRDHLKQSKSHKRQ